MIQLSFCLGDWVSNVSFAHHFFCFSRNKLTRIISNGFRFDGRGYVTLSAREVGFKPNKEGSLILKFKTYAQNGLLVFMGKDRDFISLELRDGHVFYQYDLGGMPAQLKSNKTYNDGQWHTIEAQRIDQDGFLRVDIDPGNRTISL